MVINCLVPGCSHNATSNGCRFFCLPIDSNVLYQWKRILNISSTLIGAYKAPRICSCHFRNHDKQNGPMNPLKENSLSNDCSSSKKKRFEALPLIEEDSIVAPSINVISTTLSAKTSAKEISCVSTQTSPKSLSDVATETPADNYGASIRENSKMKFKIDQLEKKLMAMNLRFEFRFIENVDAKVFAHTGIPSKRMFDAVFETMSKVEIDYNQGWNVEKIPKKEQLLLTLMKLRMNLLHHDLAQRFGCSIGTVSNIFRTWVLALHEVFFLKLMEKIPSRKKNQRCLPVCFYHFSDCRIVVDCTEMYSDKPGNMHKQRKTFSPYKHHNTCKGLVGIAPNGIITYISELYPGSTSDKRIVELSGILDQLEFGDLVLADKGFLIDDILPYGVRLNIPPLLTTSQFTQAQIRRTEMIAKARVHVERSINKMKNFAILKYIPSEMFNFATEIFQVCGALTNFQNPVINETAQLLY